MTLSSVFVVLLAVAVLALLWTEPAPADAPADEARTAIERVLDDFHAAAATADEERYFGHFAPEAVFLGTDATERWTVEEFRRFAHPHFSKGKGWTYLRRERHVVVSPGNDTASFDELLDNSGFGTCRGSGMLRRTPGGWKIVLYDLSIPIPNDLAHDLTARIRAGAGAAPEETTVYVVRHAERDDAPGDRDPPLNERGRQRAEALARTLRSVGLAAIYATPLRRAQETVGPCARAQGLRAVAYDPFHPEALLQRIRERPGAVSLVCGHTNTLLPFLKALGVEAPPEVPEDAHDDLFVVRLRDGRPPSFQHLHYGD